MKYGGNTITNISHKREKNDIEIINKQFHQKVLNNSEISVTIKSSNFLLLIIRGKIH